MSISLITRADDFGSSRSANRAIVEAAITGDYIRNVSCMAPAPMMADGAPLLKDCTHICLGMHFTINAEWSLIKWPPISDISEVPALVTEEGAFLADPALFTQRMPPMEQVLMELNAQLDYLTGLGLPIRYVDSHMLPEKFIPGLADVLSQWANQKGLVNHLQYYRFPSAKATAPCVTLETGLKALENWLDVLSEGQYFTVLHPAVGGREMLLCCNRDIPMGTVSAERNVEYELLLSRQPERMCEERGIRRLRYDEALPQANPMMF